MVNPFRRFWSKPKPQPPKAQPAQRVPEATRAMIVSLFAAGASFEEVQALYPDMEEDALRTILKGAVRRVSPFLDH